MDAIILKLAASALRTLGRLNEKTSETNHKPKNGNNLQLVQFDIVAEFKAATQSAVSS